MKRWLKPLGVLMTLLLLTAVLSLSAAAQIRVPDIAVEVTVCADGSGIVRQVWNTKVDEGTEFYLPFRTNGYLKIEDFTVSDNSGTYTYIDDWDIDASFEEKANRCGLHPTDEGYELCWGVSRYGENRYTLQYTVRHMFNAYTDSDGTLFRFVNSELNFTPTNVRLTLHLEDGTPITDSICNIWAFGYDGDIVFKNGTIIAETASPIRSENHMTLMVEFEKGVLQPARSENKAFADVKEYAFRDSDYQIGDENGRLVVLVLLSLILLLAVAAIVTAVVITVRHRRQLRQLQETFGYWRESPNEGNLDASAYLGRLFALCKEDAVIGAYMLRMIADGCLEPIRHSTVGFMGFEKQKDGLRLVREPSGDAHAKQLYQILQAACGDDGILDEKELETYCRRKATPLRSFLNASGAAGKRYFRDRNCFKCAEPHTVGRLTDAGKNELGQLLGIRKYLNDFSLLAEREIAETAVWQDYMVYAQLLGIADKVIDQLKDLYPERLPEIEEYTRQVVFVNTYYHSMYHAMRAREQEIEAQRAGGSGGHASFGGGGGFSGGGCGGGVR